MIGPAPCMGLIVGDAAASDLDPFTPDESTLLDVLLRRNGLELDWIHRTAIVPWKRPIPSVSPTKDEINQGMRSLVETGRTVEPSYTLLCGRGTAAAMFPRTLDVARGRFRDMRGLSYPRGGRVWMFTWHPRQVLRNPLMQDEFAMDVAMFALAVYEANARKITPGKKQIIIPHP